MKVKRCTTALVLASGLALTLAWLLAGAPVPSAQAALQSSTADVIYVDADAAGPADGLTWSTAFTNVQDALINTAPGDEIWVAEGVYTPTYRADSGDARTATFVLTNSIALYGGFAATETLRTQRDWEAHITVLSGDLDGNDVTDAHSVLTKTANIVGANAYHVVTSNGVTETAKLDGFTVTGGKADGPNQVDYRGGGMYNESSSPKLINVTFSSNFAYYGGGMANWYYSNPKLTNITFSGNSTEHSGGGIYNWGNSNPMLTNVTFNGNSASAYGGGMFNWGWGYEVYSSPTLTNVTFCDNSAFSGGGMYTYHSSPTLTAVTFNGNSADANGGGMNSSHSSPALTNVVFSDNVAGDEGGGMYNGDSSNPMLMNVTFSGNTAAQGGGMMNYSRSSPLLTNVTFSSNTASDGGGIANRYSNPTLANCILWGNTANSSGPQIHNDNSTPIISYSLVQDGCPTDASCSFIMNANPQFVNSTQGDLRLLPPSPAIDAGDNGAVPLGITTDLGGSPRFLDIVAIPDTGAGSPPIVDMGAYEATETSWLWPHQVFVPLILNN